MNRLLNAANKKPIQRTTEIGKSTSDPIALDLPTTPEEMMKKMYPTSPVAKPAEQEEVQKEAETSDKPTIDPEVMASIQATEKMWEKHKTEQASQPSAADNSKSKEERNTPNPISNPENLPPIKIDDVDKQRYIQSMINGEPFTKTYPIMGGLGSITFREVTDTDHNLAHMEAIRHMMSLGINNTFLFSRIKLNFQLVLSCIDITLPTRGSVWAETKRWSDVLEEIKEYNKDMPEKESKEYSLNDYYKIFEAEISSESVMVLVRDAYAKYVNLKLSLETAAYDENFYEATK